MLNSSAVGHSRPEEEVKLHAISLLTIKVHGIGVGIVPFIRAVNDADCFCSGH
jgi:hypothetical protein